MVLPFIQFDITCFRYSKNFTFFSSLPINTHFSFKNIFFCYFNGEGNCVLYLPCGTETSEMGLKG